MAVMQSEGSRAGRATESPLRTYRARVLLRAGLGHADIVRELMILAESEDEAIDRALREMAENYPDETEDAFYIRQIDACD